MMTAHTHHTPTYIFLGDNAFVLSSSIHCTTFPTIFIKLLVYRAGRGWNIVKPMKGLMSEQCPSEATSIHSNVVIHPFSTITVYVSDLFQMY